MGFFALLYFLFFLFVDFENVLRLYLLDVIFVFGFCIALLPILIALIIMTYDWALKKKKTTNYLSTS